MAKLADNTAERSLVGQNHDSNETNDLTAISAREPEVMLLSDELGADIPGVKTPKGSSPEAQGATPEAHFERQQKRSFEEFEDSQEAGKEDSRDSQDSQASTISSHALEIRMRAFRTMLGTAKEDDREQLGLISTTANHSLEEKDLGEC
jgi:hypothetical protein